MVRITKDEEILEIQKILNERCNPEQLRKIHTYALQQIINNSADYCTSCSDYRDMIIDMVVKMKDERMLKYFYVFMSEKLKRAL